MLRRRTLPFVAAWAIFITYILAARGIRNFFPISAFDMYQARAFTVASRVLVVEATGKALEITNYDAFQCSPERPNLADVSHCENRDVGRVEYVPRDQQIYFDEHVHPNVQNGVDVKLVWRTFLLEDRPGPPVHSDCVLAACRARKGGVVP